MYSQMLEWISLRYLWIHTNTHYTVKVFYDFSLSVRTRAQGLGPLLAPCVAEMGGDGVAMAFLEDKPVRDSDTASTLGFRLLGICFPTAHPPSSAQKAG